MWRSLLTRPDLPDYDWERIAANRNVCVSSLLDAVTAYPEKLVPRLVAGPRDGDVVCSLVAGPDQARSEQTLNSFRRCCTDIERVGRFLVLDAGLSAPDRALLQDRYGFLEFCQPDPSLSSMDPTLSEPSFGRTSTKGSGSSWARAGDSLPPKTSSLA